MKISLKYYFIVFTMSTASLCITSCSDSSIVKLAESLVKKGDPNKDLFHNTPETKESPNMDQSPILNNGAKPPLNPKNVAARVAPIAKQNPENKIVRKDTLCSPLLRDDTFKKILADATSKGFISKTDKYVLGIGVTVMPTGPDQNNMIWRELWAIETKEKTINYPIIFVGDGIGGTFMLGLKPYKGTTTL